MMTMTTKAAQARAVAQTALTELATALAAGRSQGLIDYLTAMSRFHEYSFGNVMLILSQMPDATHVAGFNAWKKMGRHVKRGEHGIVIIAPMLIGKKEEAREPGQAPESSFIRFKATHVFDVSQTEGQALPAMQKVTGNPAGHTDHLKAFIASKDIILEYEADLGAAAGLSAGGRIVLHSDLSPAEEFSTLVHELAHEMLHARSHRAKLTKTVKETEAEAVAFVVSQAIGLHPTQAAVDYIQLYDGDVTILGESLDRIQHTAAEIVAAVLADVQSENDTTKS